MGKATFAALADKLIARGLSGETPTVVVESLGSPATQVIAGSLTEIAARLVAAKPPGPCLILYGAALAGVGICNVSDLKISGSGRDPDQD
jgi:uroporphyrin-III C-methyltransferase